MKLKPEWKYAAMDEDGRWYFYRGVPVIEEDVWGNVGWEEDYDLFIFPEVEDWTKSLHTITEDGELVPYVDIPADGEKVMVRECSSSRWHRRYSTGEYVEGLLVCYDSGRDKWSSCGETSRWKEWRRPTEEELV